MPRIEDWIEGASFPSFNWGWTVWWTSWDFLLVWLHLAFKYWCGYLISIYIYMRWTISYTKSTRNFNILNLCPSHNDSMLVQCHVWILEGTHTVIATSAGPFHLQGICLVGVQRPAVASTVSWLNQIDRLQGDLQLPIPQVAVKYIYVCDFGMLREKFAHSFGRNRYQPYVDCAPRSAKNKPSFGGTLHKTKY